MAQQFHNGGGHDGSRTISIRDSKDYAVVNAPGCGKHAKTAEQAARRHKENQQNRRKAKR